MWHAALNDNLNNEIWLIHLLEKLFQNSQNVMTLFKNPTPFPNTGPNYLKILKYKYWFTTANESKNQLKFYFFY